MNKTLLNIITILWFVEVLIFEALYKMDLLSITDLLLYISLFTAMLLSFIIIKSFYKKSVVNIIIIVVSIILYLLLTLDIFVMDWQDNTTIFIDLNKILFISLITVQIKITSKHKALNKS
jgi:hypothetical protein